MTDRPFCFATAFYALAVYGPWVDHDVFSAVMAALGAGLLWVAVRRPS